MGGTPPVRYLPCVVPCKLYFLSVENRMNQLFRIFGASLIILLFPFSNFCIYRSKYFFQQFCIYCSLKQLFFSGLLFVTQVQITLYCSFFLQYILKHYFIILLFRHRDSSIFFIAVNINFLSITRYVPFLMFTVLRIDQFACRICLQSLQNVFSRWSSTSFSLSIW